MSIDLGTILGGAANAASGGLIGLFGSALTGAVSFFQAKAQYAHAEAMGRLELDRIKANFEAQKQLSADQLKAAEETNAGTAFSASQMAGNAFSSAYRWATSILTLIRPSITAALIAMTWQAYQQGTSDQRTLIVNSILALTGMAVGWWFGDRQIAKMSASKFLTPA